MADLNQLGMAPAAAPAAPAPVAAAPAAPAAKQLNPRDVFPTLPEEVKSVPLVEWLAVGEPPAVRVEPGQYFPELEPLARNLPETVKGGLDVYRSKAGETVFFNPVFISEQELQIADEDGNLSQLVPTYSELSGSQPQEVSAEKFDELLKTAEDVQTRMHSLSVPDEGESASAPSASAPAAPAASPVAQSASTPSPVTTQRIKQLVPGAPTSGAVPGSGRILNAIIKRAV